MQQSQSITLSPEYLKAIAVNTGQQTAAFEHELNLHRDEIASLLSGYHWHEKGIVQSPQITSVNFTDTLNGHFTTKYGINIHYGCSDVDINLDKTMVIQFKLTAGTALLTGEFIPEREPDSY